MKVEDTHLKARIVLGTLMEAGFGLETEVEYEEDYIQFLESTLGKLKNLKDHLKMERETQLRNYFDSKFYHVKNGNSSISRSESRSQHKMLRTSTPILHQTVGGESGENSYPAKSYKMVYPKKGMGEMLRTKI